MNIDEDSPHIKSLIIIYPVHFSNIAYNVKLNVPNIANPYINETNNVFVYVEVSIIGAIKKYHPSAIQIHAIIAPCVREVIGFP